MSVTVPGRAARRVAGRVPVMGETRYDLATAALISVLLALVAFVAILVAIWLSNLLPSNTPLNPMQLPGDGGYEDGNPDETLHVESPEDPSDDPSLSNDQQEMQLEQVLEQVITVSETAAELVAPNEYTDPTGGGNPGSAEGTGKPLGTGAGLTGGTPREQRWFVQFADKSDLKSYARQLDFFNIELGVAFRDGRIVYVRNFSTTPVVRNARISASEQRLFMNWQAGGERVKADIDLLTLAGITDVSSGIILHFYPRETEEILARLEHDYANLRPDQIRRTYFDVARDGDGFKFEVTNQKRR
ncbi:MAG: hypothetical protein R3C19_05820 [Planctomycetaceae bacterium]